MTKVTTTNQACEFKLRLTWAGLAVMFVAATSYRAHAQLYREPEGSPLPPYAKVYELRPDRKATPEAVEEAEETGNLLNIMLTGYWPPSNEMIRRFSSNPDQNPEGWIGHNWEGRGYHIYAFFPEFPGGLGKGVGDFEVDYQDTSADFWQITGEVTPVAIITFGRSDADSLDWEVESRHQNRSFWWFDYQSPYLPTPSPPDDSVPANYVRYSSLPMQAIVDAVDVADLNIIAYISDNYAGNFLCEYVGYHGTWYHDLYGDPDDPVWNIAAGHIHVGGLVELSEAITATEITLRVLIDYLDSQRPVPGDFDGDRYVDQEDFDMFQACVTGPTVPYDPQDLPQGCTLTPDALGVIPADFDADSDVDLSDFGIFQRCYSGANEGDPHCADRVD